MQEDSPPSIGKEIERATGEAFLNLYNEKYGMDFKIIEHADVPDLRCEDSEKNKLNIEITLTEDQPKDIAAALGRSSHRSPEALREHLRRVREGKEVIKFSSLVNVRDRLVYRISEKLLNNYGSGAALVVREISPLDWDWDGEIAHIAEEVKKRLNNRSTPFDKGIWILGHSKAKIWKIL